MHSRLLIAKRRHVLLTCPTFSGRTWQVVHPPNPGRLNDRVTRSQWLSRQVTGTAALLVSQPLQANTSRSCFYQGSCWLNLGAPSPTPLLTGPPAHVPVVVPGRGASPGDWWVFSCGLVFGPLNKAPNPEGQQGSSDSQSGWVHCHCAWLQAASSWCWCWFSAAWSLSGLPVVPPPAPQPGPSLGPSQASLMNALALLSNVLSVNG